MKAAAQTKADAEKQLLSFIDKFEPAHQALIRGARKVLRKRLPAAIPAFTAWPSSRR